MEIRSCKHKNSIGGLLLIATVIMALIALTITCFALCSAGGADEDTTAVTSELKADGPVILVSNDTKTDADDTVDTVSPDTVVDEIVPEEFSQYEIDLIAKTVYGEALVTQSETEMAAVVWCILNRVDAKGFACGNSIEYVVTYPRQFHGYNENNPVTPEIERIVRSVLASWSLEKQGVENVGRILPKEYIYFVGDGRHNHFSKEYMSKQYWDWSLDSPFET